MTDKAMMTGNIQGHRFYGWVLERIQHFYEVSGEDEWKPAKLIEDLVAQGKGFKDFTR